MALMWQASEDAQLRSLIAAGKTYQQIANEVGASRNMVAGRVYRLGLRGPRSRAA